MILLLAKLPNWQAVRLPFWKFLRHLAQYQGLFSTESLSCVSLVFLFLTLVGKPLQGQTDVVPGQKDLTIRASTLMQTGKFHDAELLWRQLEQQHPKDPLIHGNMGVALAQQGKLEEAAAEYRRSLALKPNQPDASFDLGVAEFKQGHFAAAIPPFELFAKERPDDHRSSILLGMSYFGLRKYDKASVYLHTALEDDSSNLELHNVLAQSCLWSNQYNCALTEFKSIVAANPDAVQAHMLLAEALDGMGRTDDAINELEAAARISPKEPDLHFELGYLYFKQRD